LTNITEMLDITYKSQYVFVYMCSTIFL